MGNEGEEFESSLCHLKPRWLKNGNRLPNELGIGGFTKKIKAMCLAIFLAHRLSC